MWLSVEHLSPPLNQCLYDDLSPLYDSSSGKWSNAPGVEVRTVDFGGVKGLSHLDPNVRASVYYQPMIDYLTMTLGYEVGQDLFGAPYGEE